MISIEHTNTRYIGSYGKHLKQLTLDDKRSRFGYAISDANIDQLILNIVYDPSQHELWSVSIDDEIVGWGHMAKNADNSWELAVSVDKKFQQKGIGNKLIGEMLIWAKIFHISEVYMHCIEDNKVIQHLANKHGLQTRYRGAGERTATIVIPEPTFFDVNDHRWKEHALILREYANLRKRWTDLWTS
jgi:GNAT superfamily N-acetyltransferase